MTRSQRENAEALARIRRSALAEELALEEAFLTKATEAASQAFRRNDYPHGLRLLTEAREAREHIERLRAERGEAA